MDGGDLFQPLTFTGTIKRSFHLYFENFNELTSIHFSCMCLDYALRFIPGQFDAAMHFAAMIGVVVIDGAVYHMVANIYIGEETGCFKSIQAAWQSKFSLLGSDFLLQLIIDSTPAPLNLALHFNQWRTFVDSPPPTSNPKPMIIVHVLAAAFGIMMFLFLVGGHYAWSRALLAGPAIVVEGIGNPIKGLRRSWGLSTGHCYYPMRTIVFNAILLQLQTVLPKTGSISEFQSGFLFRPLFAVVATVLYLNQRIDRENLNAEVLAKEIEAHDTTDNGTAVNEAAENGEEVGENPWDVRCWFYLAVFLLWPVSIYLGLFFWTLHTLIVAATIPKIFRLWRSQNRV